MFSTIWYLLRQTRFHAVPASIRYLIFLGWRAVMMRAYEAHKSLVLWRECGATCRSGPHSTGLQPGSQGHTAQGTQGRMGVHVAHGGSQRKFHTLSGHDGCPYLDTHNVQGKGALRLARFDSYTFSMCAMLYAWCFDQIFIMFITSMPHT